jgi:membrane protein YqaA with SNARE-associated domain
MTGAGLFSLFLGSLLASTILPGGVEVLLYAMVESGSYSSQSLLVTATAGNTLGGIVTYGMGVLLFRGLSHVSWGQRLQKYFKLEPSSLERVRRWGIPCLLLSWMPVIGDPLCLAAGYLGLAFWPSALMIATGKFLRYLALLWLFGWY